MEVVLHLGPPIITSKVAHVRGRFLVPHVGLLRRLAAVLDLVMARPAKPADPRRAGATPVRRRRGVVSVAVDKLHFAFIITVLAKIEMAHLTLHGLVPSDGAFPKLSAAAAATNRCIPGGTRLKI